MVRNRYDECIDIGGTKGLLLALVYDEKIAAIKLLRECTGMSLLEAKNGVEQVLNVLGDRAVKADRKAMAEGRVVTDTGTDPYDMPYSGRFVVVHDSDVGTHDNVYDAENEARDRCEGGIGSDAILYVCKIVATATNKVSITKEKQ